MRSKDSRSSWVVMVMHNSLRRFRLRRVEDESGVSGTGVVALGVQFPDGAVVFEWLNDQNESVDTSQNGLTLKQAPDGIEDTIEVHGHGGKTVVEWIDEPANDT